MAKARRRKQSSDKLKSAADYLSDVAAVRVRLESGEKVEFDLESELNIPTDPHHLAKAARKAPAQVAFWNYQTERALAKLRGAEAKLEYQEGRQLLIWREWYLEEECETPPQGTLKARLDSDLICRPFRVALRARKTEYGIIRSVRDAVDHRARMIRMLIGKYEPT